MAAREDLLVEESGTLDGSGNWHGDWIESAGIDSIRVAGYTPGGTLGVQESQDASTVVSGVPGSVSSGGVGEYPLTARYFRLAAYGVASATFVVTARKLPI